MGRAAGQFWFGSSLHGRLPSCRQFHRSTAQEWFPARRVPPHLAEYVLAACARCTSASIGERFTHARMRLVNVGVGRHPVTDGHSHDSHATPRRSAEPDNALCLYPTYDIICKAVVITCIGQEPHQSLVYDRYCYDLSPRKFTYTLD